MKHLMLPSGGRQPPGDACDLRDAANRGLTPPARKSKGVTLLEMVLALTLFLGAITVLAQIVWNGQRAALQGRLRTEAAFRCESKLAEIVAGVEPFQPQQNVAFPDDPQWTWSASIGSGSYPELMQVKVIVQHTSENPAANAEFALERWIRDPSLFLDAALQQATSSVTGSTSSSLGGSR